MYRPLLSPAANSCRRVKPEGAGGGGGGGGAYDYADGDGEGGGGGYLRPDALDQARIEDLIRQHLGTNSLEVGRAGADGYTSPN